MTAKGKSENNTKPSENGEKPPKFCFVIMPIADHPNYEPGHFKRVYDNLVAPACRQAGYEPIRADENSSSNMIMHDILLNIVKSEMVICDLSTNNANVFYELGLRQAFNKKTVLITDGREKTPFDLLGFRYQLYSSSLRVDTVRAEIKRISVALTSTENMLANEVNSIVKLLEIDSANIEIVQPNENQAFMLQMFNSLSAQIANLAQPSQGSTGQWVSAMESRKNGITLPMNPNSSFIFLESDENVNLEDGDFYFKNECIGTFTEYSNDNRYITFTNGHESTTFPNTKHYKSRIFRA
ncbi:hypothetical protein [Pantoea sp. OVA07A]|uniref:hypothetical protein n=1 Tax=Pantoea sp. OVA07A TaxID=2862677 RepID=UPI001CBC8C2D|nr:hypothetical protein [Pantoea sp. OVA07A]